jgi:6-pyruvoyltetrahydropterin/6-carboxytetrahydropterin synthase
MKKFTGFVEPRGARFSAAHFLAIKGSPCERLHGHNYTISVRVSAVTLSAGATLVEFGLLKAEVVRVCAKLDHRVLIATGNAAVRVSTGASVIRVAYRKKSYRFPSNEVVLMNVENTTCEALAEWIGLRLAPWMRRYAPGVQYGVCVQESPNQGAEWQSE